MKPPIAKKETKHLVNHSHTRIDNYYWLRDLNNLEVKQLIEQENKFFNSLETIISKEKDEIKEEFRKRKSKTDSTLDYIVGEDEYHSIYNGMKYPRIEKRNRLNNQSTVVFDFNSFYKDEDSILLGYLPGNAGIIGFAQDLMGNGVSTIRFWNTFKKKFLDEKIENTTGNFVWNRSGDKIVYTLYNAQLRPYCVKVFDLESKRHFDLYEEYDHTFNLFLSKSTSKEKIFINLDNTHCSEIFGIDADLNSLDLSIVCSRKNEKKCSVECSSSFYYFITDQKVYQCDRTNNDMSNWEEIIPYRKNILLTGRMVLLKNYLVVEAKSDGLPRFITYKISTGEIQNVTVAETQVYSAYLMGLVDYESDTFFVHLSSYNLSNRQISYNLKNQNKNLVYADSNLDVIASHVVVKREFFVARDGENIPITLIGLDKQVGCCPVLITAYAAYGEEVEPEFDHRIFSLLNRGFKIVIVHARGGGFYQMWHQKGSLMNKRKSIEDFIDAAEYLHRNEVVLKNNLFALGESAGGIVVGASMNERPDLFKAVILNVPFVDVITTLSDDQLPLTTTEYNEWGNPVDDEDVYNYMLTYSPYDNIKKQDYPSVLIFTSLNDERVPPWESLKFVYKLREYTIDESNIVIRIDNKYGHFGGSVNEELDETRSTIYSYLINLVDT